jgi:hypothetical protein
MGGYIPCATITHNFDTRTHSVVLTQRAVACLGQNTPQTRHETAQRIAHTENVYVPTDERPRPQAEMITHQQFRSALSRLFPYSSTYILPSNTIDDSKRRPVLSLVKKTLHSHWL